MKYMKLGTRPDVFFTEEAIRTVMIDVPSDLTIRINNITYRLHKLVLLRKCGLLQRLCTASSEESGNLTLELHDIPGGENALELCAKFCYGITIILSAHNFVSAFCAAKFLRMTDTVDDENFVPKLETFFISCILKGWKDSIAALQSTVKIPEWSENLGIIRRCIDSIVEKILRPPEKVAWSFTYTRVGYDRDQQNRVPKDWWTEDVSDLDIDLFRCIITAVRSAGTLTPRLIGEALHVYACRWLPDLTSTSTSTSSSSCRDEENSSHIDVAQQKKILETIVSLIPVGVDGSPLPVSTGFLLRLLRLANVVGVSAGTKAELIRRSGQQLEAAELNDLLLLLPHCYSSQQQMQSAACCYDIDLVRALLESFLRFWKRQPKERQSIRSVTKVGKLLDSYLQEVATHQNASVQQIISLAAAVPEIARPHHDQLYNTINIYLQEHPHLTKADKKELCRVLDCHKLSPEVQMELVRNERLPLRTVVQVLFFNLNLNLERSSQLEHQKLHSSTGTGEHEQQTPKLLSSGGITDAKEAIPSNTTPGTGHGVGQPRDAITDHQASGKGKEIREEELIRRRKLIRKA